MLSTQRKAQSVFTNAVELSEKVAIYIPSTVDVNVQVNNSKMVNETIEFLSDMFGGATAQKAVGGWVSDEIGLVKENVTIVFAYADDLESEDLEDIKEYAEMVKYEMDQEAVSVEIGTSLFLV